MIRILFTIITIATTIKNVNYVEIWNTKMFSSSRKQRISSRKTRKIENAETLNFKTRFEFVRTISLMKFTSSITLVIIFSIESIKLLNLKLNRMLVIFIENYKHFLAIWTLFSLNEISKTIFSTNFLTKISIWKTNYFLKSWRFSFSFSNNIVEKLIIRKNDW